MSDTGIVEALTLTRSQLIPTVHEFVDGFQVDTLECLLDHRGDSVEASLQLGEVRT